MAVGLLGFCGCQNPRLGGVRNHVFISGCHFGKRLNLLYVSTGVLFYTCCGVAP